MSVKLRRLWVQVTADRRRAGILGAMLTLGMLLWARIIVISNVPKMAVADPDAQNQIDSTVQRSIPGRY